MISAIASLLHLRAVDDPQAARRMVADGHALVCEDDVKAVVVKLRAEYDALRAAQFADLAEAVAALRLNLRWARDLIGQCRGGGRAEASPFVKQLGARPVFGEGDLPESMWSAYDANGYDQEEIDRAGREGRLKFIDAAGADPSEWPLELRAREFPR